MQHAIKGMQETGYDATDDCFDDGHENTVAVRCGLLLSTLAAIVKGDLASAVLEQVRATLEKPGDRNWHEDYCALLTVTSVIEGPDPLHITRLL